MPRKKVTEEQPMDVTASTATSIPEMESNPLAESVDAQMEAQRDDDVRTAADEVSAVDTDAEAVIQAADPSANAAESLPAEKSVRKKRTKRAEMQSPTRESDSEERSRPKNETSGVRRSFFEQDFRALDRDLTPEGQQEWNSIYASYRGRSVMSGTVVGVDHHSLLVHDKKTGQVERRELNCAVVIPFRVRILIPETEMWLQGDERPSYVLRDIPGATVDFVVIHVDREAGFAVASRRLALAARRHYYSNQPYAHQAGWRTECSVLAVGPRRCLVSCFGYDVNLTQRELSYVAVPDLRETYYAGQTLPCIVKKYDKTEDTLTISVKETAPNPYDGASFRHPPHSHRRAVIAGKYGGGVFCNLPDGVTVLCNYSFQYDDAAFHIGDRVMLIIQRYDDDKKQIYGKIVSKC